MYGSFSHFWDPLTYFTAFLAIASSDPRAFPFTELILIENIAIMMILGSVFFGGMLAWYKTKAGPVRVYLSGPVRVYLSGVALPALVFYIVFFSLENFSSVTPQPNISADVATPTQSLTGLQGNLGFSLQPEDIAS